MATQRYISTSFWNDPWIQTLDPSEKLLYLYFMTSPLSSISGIYEVTMRRVCFDTGYNEDTTKRIIKRFENDKKLYYCCGFVVIPSWPKHQKWEEKETIKRGIEKHLNTVPKRVWCDIVSRKIPYQYPLEEILLPYGYDPSYLDIEFEFEFDIIKDGQNCTKIAPNVVEEEFSRFWHVWPKKVQKKTARQKYFLMHKKKRLPEINELLEIIEKWKNTEDWKKDDGRYIPHPATWINQERWEDALPTQVISQEDKNYKDGWDD
ncbi:MAG: hypothetical protein PQJ59_16775 [Spirochaetales bacterium]|nr:hypothetical protein [Spirochaetales bacterium]